MCARKAERFSNVFFIIIIIIFYYYLLIPDGTTSCLQLLDGTCIRKEIVGTKRLSHMPFLPFLHIA